MLLHVYYKVLDIAYLFRYLQINEYVNFEGEAMTVYISLSVNKKICFDVVIKFHS